MEKSVRPFAMMAILALAVCIVASNFSAAKEKKSTLPAYVLQAQTVFVMIDPDEAIPVNDPGGNKTAREDVEKALMTWGRLKLSDGDERCGPGDCGAKGRQAGDDSDGRRAAE